MKKLFLLITMITAGWNFILHTQEQKKPFIYFGIPFSKYGKPAAWARPQTVAYTLVEDEQIPQGYVPSVITSSGKVFEARKRLPVSGKEEFWNKFISGYGEDKEVEKELRNKYLGHSKLSSEESNELFEKEDQETKFLKKIEESTPSHYISPRYVNPKVDTGFFSGWRNWWANLWKPKNTPTYTPARPISVPLKSSESE